jgi:hypothetical protein
MQSYLTSFALVAPTFDIMSKKIIAQTNVKKLVLYVSF